MSKMATTLLSVIFILSLLAHTSNGYTDPVFQKEIEYLQNFVTEDQVIDIDILLLRRQLNKGKCFEVVLVGVLLDRLGSGG